MSNKFSCVVIDAPWSFSDLLTMSDTPRGADANYSLMSNKDIAALDVKSLADPNGCVLALWVPSSLLQEGLDTMKAYGFNHKQTYIWVKTKKSPLKKLNGKIAKITKNAWQLKKLPPVKEYLTEINVVINDFKVEDTLSFFMGRCFRNVHEICLIGTNSNNIYKKLLNKSQRTVSFGENLKHSAKPEHLQDSLDIMFGDDAKKIELFARRQRPGWTCLGNEIDGRDIRDAIKDLL